MSTFAVAAAFLAACVSCLLLTPLVARAAHRFGAVDSPDGNRKNQTLPIPLGGGLAVAVTAALVVTVTIWLAPGQVSATQSTMLAGLFLAAGILVLVGTLDDTIGLTGIYKLIGQTLAASLLVAEGFQFNVISLLGWEISLGSLGIPFSIFFCLGAINAFNLLDGADGLAASIGIIVCLTLGIICLTRGDLEAAVVCFAFSGALLAFLRFNAPPASIYLGDTGSMLIGLVVAAVAIHCSVKAHTAFALSVPLAICAIPVLDVVAALIRRVTTGQSVFTPDRGHLHHALLLRGWPVGKTVAFISGLTAITCAGALASYYLQYDLIAAAVTGCVFVSLAASRVFGHAELALIRSRTRSLAHTLRFGRLMSPGNELQETVHVQGHRGWEKLWLALYEAASVYHLTELRLNVNIPRLHESYYGNWKRPGTNPSKEVWHIMLPLMVGNQQVGRIAIFGDSAGVSGIRDMQQVLDFLEPLEEDIKLLLCEEHLLGELDLEPHPAAPYAEFQTLNS